MGDGILFEEDGETKRQQMVGRDHPLPVTMENAGAGYDAFGRFRVSNTGQRLDAEFIYNKQPDIFDEVTTNGTVTRNSNPRDLTLSLDDANNGSSALMSSYPVPYTPGNSQLIDITSVLNLADLANGVTQIFFRTKVSGSVVETTYDQTDWNINTVSDVNWAYSQIFAMDFQSLKVGSITFYMARNKVIVPVHVIHNDNIRNTGYWQLANLPVYWRIYNDATYTYMECGYGDEDNAIGFRHRVAANATATMKAICCTVKSEGGRTLEEMPGFPRSVDTGVTSTTVSTTLIPIISIRTSDTFNGTPNLGLIKPVGFQLETDEAIKYEVIEGGTLTGGSWTAVNSTTSCAAVNSGATAITGGRRLKSGYIYATSTGAAGSQSQGAEAGILSKAILWERLSSEPGNLTIAAVRTGATDAEVFASLEWEEIR